MPAVSLNPQARLARWGVFASPDDLRAKIVEERRPQVGGRQADQSDSRGSLRLGVRV